MTRHRLTATLLLLCQLGGLILAGSAQAAAPGLGAHDVLLLRAGTGTHSSLVELQAGTARVTLPLGLFDGPGRRIYTATPAADGRHSLVQVFDAAGGRLLRSATLSGRYSTQAADYSGAALSFDGTLLALRSLTTTAGRTSAIVVDTTTLRVMAMVRLQGHFGLDAVDPRARRLYLTEDQPQRGPQAYDVRSYDLSRGFLEPGAVIEKEDTTGTMSGVAWTRAWSPDGDWLFTLYVRPGRLGMFIHSLGVEYRLAQCIFPPTDHATAATLSHYVLAVSNDGSALYAVDPLLGQVFAMRGSLPFGSATQARLSQRAGSAAHVRNGMAISRDGASLYVATTRGIWVLDTATLTLRTTYLAGQNVASVALSRVGRRLYALEPGKGMVTALDATSGRLLGAMPAGTASWAIERVGSKE